jgi:hypothetical protein
MYDSLAKAAAATGVTKSTMLWAIRSHRMSAAKSETGDWQIDPAELHRVFPPADRAGNGAAERGATANETALEAQIAALRDVSELLRQQVDDMRADRDAWRDQAQAGQRLLAAPERTQRAPWWRRITG